MRSEGERGSMEMTAPRGASDLRGCSGKFLHAALRSACNSERATHALQGSASAAIGSNNLVRQSAPACGSNAVSNCGPTRAERRVLPSMRARTHLRHRLEHRPPRGIGQALGAGALRQHAPLDKGRILDARHVADAGVLLRDGRRGRRAGRRLWQRVCKRFGGKVRANYGSGVKKGE